MYNSPITKLDYEDTINMEPYRLKMNVELTCEAKGSFEHESLVYHEANSVSLYMIKEI